MCDSMEEYIGMDHLCLCSGYSGGKTEALVPFKFSNYFQIKQKKLCDVNQRKKEFSVFEERKMQKTAKLLIVLQD